jgi:hypothetical protein
MPVDVNVVTVAGDAEPPPIVVPSIEPLLMSTGLAISVGFLPRNGIR